MPRHISSFYWQGLGVARESLGAEGRVDPAAVEGAERSAERSAAAAADGVAADRTARWRGPAAARADEANGEL